MNNTSPNGRQYGLGSSVEGLFQIADLTGDRGATRLIVDADGNVGIGTLNARERLDVDGIIVATGDIQLNGADCAEEFEVAESEALEPGTVMVIGAQHVLHRSTEPYDNRVVGTLSGAGD